MPTAALLADVNRKLIAPSKNTNPIDRYFRSAEANSLHDFSIGRDAQPQASVTFAMKPDREGQPPGRYRKPRMA